MYGGKIGEMGSFNIKFVQIGNFLSSKFGTISSGDGQNLDHFLPCEQGTGHIV